MAGLLVAPAKMMASHYPTPTEVNIAAAEVMEFHLDVVALEREVETAEVMVFALRRRTGERGGLSSP